jgi:hypothetical protein
MAIREALGVLKLRALPLVADERRAEHHFLRIFDLDMPSSLLMLPEGAAVPGVAEPVVPVEVVPDGAVPG